MTIASLTWEAFVFDLGAGCVVHAAPFAAQSSAAVCVVIFIFGRTFLIRHKSAYARDGIFAIFLRCICSSCRRAIFDSVTGQESQIGTIIRTTVRTDGRRAGRRFDTLTVFEVIPGITLSTLSAVSVVGCAVFDGFTFFVFTAAGSAGENAVTGGRSLGKTVHGAGASLLAGLDNAHILSFVGSGSCFNVFADIVSVDTAVKFGGGNVRVSFQYAADCHLVLEGDGSGIVPGTDVGNDDARSQGFGFDFVFNGCRPPHTNPNGFIFGIQRFARRNGSGMSVGVPTAFTVRNGESAVGVDEIVFTSVVTIGSLVRTTVFSGGGVAEFAPLVPSALGFPDFAFVVAADAFFEFDGGNAGFKTNGVGYGNAPLIGDGTRLFVGTAVGNDQTGDKGSGGEVTVYGRIAPHTDPGVGITFSGRNVDGGGMTVSVPGTSGIRNVNGTVSVLEETAVRFDFTDFTNRVAALVSGVFELFVGAAA